MKQERLQELLATQFNSQRLLPLQIIYLAITAGVVVLFTVGFILGLRSAGQTVSKFAAVLAYISMAAPVLIFFISNKIFMRRVSAIAGEGDVFGQLRAALLAKAGIVESGALFGVVAWLLICLRTHLSFIPPVYYGVFVGLLVMLLNTAIYLPTPGRIRRWLSKKVD